jgi:hypothetical protein
MTSTSLHDINSRRGRRGAVQACTCAYAAAAKRPLIGRALRIVCVWGRKWRGTRAQAPLCVVYHRSSWGRGRLNAAAAHSIDRQSSLGPSCHYQRRRAEHGRHVVLAHPWPPPSRGNFWPPHRQSHQKSLATASGSRSRSRSRGGGRAHGISHADVGTARRAIAQPMASRRASIDAGVLWARTAARGKKPQ